MADRWAADPASTFATYSPPEVMAKHVAPRQSILDRLKSWLRRLGS